MDEDSVTPDIEAARRVALLLTEGGRYQDAEIVLKLCHLLSVTPRSRHQCGYDYNPDCDGCKAAMHDAGMEL